MSTLRLADYVGHMLEAAQQACAYVEGMDKDDFLADRRTQQAVVMNLVIIGEAATRCLRDHDAFLEQFPDVPWRGMRGMRNRIAHGYFDIDLDTVWETIQIALPELSERLPAIREKAEVAPPAASTREC